MKKKITLQPELILFLSILIYKEPTVILPFLAACILHELGHITMLHCIKHCTYSISLQAAGAVITTESLTYRQILWATLSGPAANFLGLLYAPLSPAFAKYNLVLGIYNLLPLSFLDGGVILNTLLRVFRPPDQADVLSGKISKLTLYLLLFFSLLISLWQKNPLPSIAATLLFMKQYSACRKEGHLL